MPRIADTFHHVFEIIVARAIEEGPAGSDGFAVAASLIAAGTNKYRSVVGSEKTDWPAHAI